MCYRGPWKARVGSKDVVHLIDEGPICGAEMADKLHETEDIVTCLPCLRAHEETFGWNQLEDER